MKEPIYVYERDSNFFNYIAYVSSARAIAVNVVGKYGKEHELNFYASSELTIRAAYNRFIIAEERLPSGKSVTYWVLKVTKKEVSIISTIGAGPLDS